MLAVTGSKREPVIGAVLCGLIPAPVGESCKQVRNKHGYCFISPLLSFCFLFSFFSDLRVIFSLY